MTDEAKGVWLLIGLGVLGLGWWFGWWDDGLDILLYSTEYAVNPAQVTIDNRPTDCDWSSRLLKK
jgi:hypothetical protein